MLQNFVRTENPCCRSSNYATTAKIWLMKRTRSLTAPLGTPKTCPFLIMFIISYPLIVRRAVLKEPKLIHDLTNRFSQGWSCSTILLRYFFCRSFTSLGNFFSAMSSLIAFG